MTLLNMTPHALNVVCENNTITTIEPSGTVVRVSQNMELVTDINGIPVYRSQYGELEGLPEPQAHTRYILSAMAAAAAKAAGRDDILSPGELIRDENGQPIGCRGLIQW